ncbi:MAG: M16 family metallopeptidase [Terriglobia bacterium]
MLRRALAISLMIWLTFVAAWSAEEKPLPKDLPPYGALKPFAAPQATERKLPNGLSLRLVPRRDFPKVAFAVAIRGGLAVDPKDRPGLSELIVAVVDQGTKTRNARQIAEAIQAAGGDLSGNARADSILVATSVLSEKVEAGLAVLADILENATFPDSEVELAKRNASDRLRSQEADPFFLASRALSKVVFGEHPYSVISPTQDSISQTTAAELRTEYARRFRPDQAVLVAVGDFDVAKMEAMVQSALSGWKTPPEAPVALPEKPTEAAPHAGFFVARPGSVQTTLAVGSLGPTRGQPDFAPAQVANAIYGGMFGSRLTRNIREDKGYTYSPFTFLNPRRSVSVFQSWAAVRNEVTGATLNEIDYELNRMATTAPSKNEVEDAERFLIGNRALELQSGDEVARELASLWVFGLPSEELGRESERIQKVTAPDVEAAGKKYFAAARQAVVAVGEEKVVKEELAPFGITISPAP